MRNHKASSINRAEAGFIIKYANSSLNQCVVIEHFGQWFDVRRMTEKEVERFIDDLTRARNARSQPASFSLTSERHSSRITFHGRTNSHGRPRANDRAR